MRRGFHITAMQARSRALRANRQRRMSRDAQIWQGILGIEEPVKSFYPSATFIRQTAVNGVRHSVWEVTLSVGNIHSVVIDDRQRGLEQRAIEAARKVAGQVAAWPNCIQNPGQE